MASATKVKTYLAQWFQLGKKLVWSNGQADQLPNRILLGDRFAPEFEACWHEVMSSGGENCHLEGSKMSIATLLSPSWNIEPCSRCDMPVPMIVFGVQPVDCTCSDLDNWPNSELPSPHLPVDSQAKLDKISKRLKNPDKPGF